MAGGPDPQLVASLLALIGRRLDESSGGLLTVAICGAQGSGKSTLAAALLAELAKAGIAGAVLSLDDLYLTLGERQALAVRVHPLFATRGVPGTHDVALGLATLGALTRGLAAPLPRFDKGADDRLPEALWPRAPAHTRVLLFEGWCVGARPQDEAALARPVNALEAEEDADAVWRRHANAALAGEYQALFARLDALFLLAAPGFEVVARWREEQEAELRARAGDAARGVMTPGQVVRFIQHYERLTRHILAEMPARADAVVRLGERRETLGIELRS